MSSAALLFKKWSPALLRLRSLLFLLIAGCSVAAASYAESLLSPRRPAVPSTVQLYVAAAVVFALVFRLPVASKQAVLEKSRHWVTKVGVIRLGLVAASVGLFAHNWSQVARLPKDTFPMLIWFASIVCLLVGIASWPSLYRRLWPAGRMISTLPWLDILVLITISAFALSLRLYGLDRLPALVGDEPISGVSALRFNLNRDVLLYVSSQGVPNVQYAFYGFVFDAFGQSVAALRLPNAFFGLMEVIFAYILGKELGGRRAGIIAAILLASLAVHVHFSRVALSIVAGSAAWTGAAAFLARGIRRGSWFDWALAGVIAGYGVSWYHTPRLLPFVFGAFAAGLLLLRPRALRWELPAIACASLGFVIGVGPLASYFWAHPDQIMGRSPETWLGPAIASLTNPSSLPQPVDVGKLFWSHFQGQLLGINISGDWHNWYRGGLPMFGPLVAPLLFIGVIAITLRMYNWRCLLLGLWLWSSFLILGVTSNNVPVFHRPVPFLAAACVTVGLSLSGIGSLWQGFFKARFSQLPYWLGVAAFVGFVALAQFSDYFLYYSPKDNWIFWDVLGRYVLSIPPESDIVMVGNLDSQARSPGVQFGSHLGKKNVLFDWKGPENPVKPSAPDRSLVFIFHYTRFGELPAIVDLYPGGTEEQLRDLKGGVLWRVYRYRYPPE